MSSYTNKIAVHKNDYIIQYRTSLSNRNNVFYKRKKQPIEQETSKININNLLTCSTNPKGCLNSDE